MLITFPSSFSAEFRPMKGAEISVMANDPGASSGAGMAKLMRATWVKTLDPGPYVWEGAPQFDKALEGDLVFGLLSQVVESVPDGAQYRFKVQCESRRHPSDLPKRHEVIVDLVARILNPPEDADPASVFKVKRLSEATVAHLRELGNRFETAVGDKRVVYKLQSRTDEPATKRLRGAVSNFTQAEIVAIQCVEVEGLKTQDVMARWEWAKGLSGPDLYRLYDEIQRDDCGIDLDFTSKCPVCGWEQSADLPFDRLFSPRTTG